MSALMTRSESLQVMRRTLAQLDNGLIPEDEAWDKIIDAILWTEGGDDGMRLYSEDAYEATLDETVDEMRQTDY